MLQHSNERPENAAKTGKRVADWAVGGLSLRGEAEAIQIFMERRSKEDGLPRRGKAPPRNDGRLSLRGEAEAIQTFMEKRCKEGGLPRRLCEAPRNDGGDVAARLWRSQ